MRTSFVSRVAFGGPDVGEDAAEIATPTRRFSLLEITSGLPDDSREEGERAAERRLRDLHGRAKTARAVIARPPEPAEVLASDRRKEARFYARLGITEAQFRSGATVASTERGEADLPTAQPSTDTLLPSEVRSGFSDAAVG